MDSFTYTFSALRGVQAGREYFVAMCPLRLLPKIFLFDEQEIPPELRAQRVLNKARVPALVRYLTENTANYVFSAITASIDGEVEFLPYEGARSPDIGQLVIPMSARFIINDGQHRRAAIEDALRECPELADETIAVVFFTDAGLKRSQQLFADLNTHAVRASSSIGILYNFRDPLANLSRQLSEQVPAFKNRTEKEKTSISNRSRKLFTLSGIYYATAALLRRRPKRTKSISKREQQIALEYWSELSQIIPEWQEQMLQSVSAAELRRDYIHVHSVTLHALGHAGADLIATYPNDWKERIQKLATVDWSRSNIKLWEGRAMVGGRMSKAGASVTRTAIAIKRVLGLPLAPDEEALEIKE